MVWPATAENLLPLEGWGGKVRWDIFLWSRHSYFSDEKIVQLTKTNNRYMSHDNNRVCVCVCVHVQCCSYMRFGDSIMSRLWSAEGARGQRVAWLIPLRGFRMLEAEAEFRMLLRRKKSQWSIKSITNMFHYFSLQSSTLLHVGGKSCTTCVGILASSISISSWERVTSSCLVVFRVLQLITGFYHIQHLHQYFKLSHPAPIFTSPSSPFCKKKKKEVFSESCWRLCTKRWFHHILLISSTASPSWRRRWRRLPADTRLFLQ